MSSEHENMWTGIRGDAYTKQTIANPELYVNAVDRLELALPYCDAPIRTVLEIGAGSGSHAIAVRALIPDAKVAVTEINPAALEYLRTWFDDVYDQSIVETAPPGTYDLVIAAGLLSGVEPGDLDRAYANVYAAVGRYLVLCDYYAGPDDEEEPIIPWYGTTLYRRDYPGDLVARFGMTRVYEQVEENSRAPSMFLLRVS